MGSLPTAFFSGSDRMNAPIAHKADFATWKGRIEDDALRNALSSLGQALHSKRPR